MDYILFFLILLAIAVIIFLAVQYNNGGKSEKEKSLLGLFVTLDKHHKNPILSPKPYLDWQAGGTFNPAAITDAYATIKITSKTQSNIHLILNMTKSEKEAQLIFDKINKVAMANIGNGLKLNLIGKLPEDKLISKSIKQRTLFTNDAPNSLASLDMKRIVNNLVYKLERKVLKTDTNKSFGSFFKRIIEQF